MFPKVLTLLGFVILAQSGVIPSANTHAIDYFASGAQGFEAQDIDHDFHTASVENNRDVDEVDHGHDEDHYKDHQKYEFDYAVQDIHTGDHKFHHEVRNGDSVVGSYSLLESDGTTRTVYYTADKHKGFNAVVEKSGKPREPEPATHSDESFSNFDQIDNHDYHHNS